MGAKLTGRPSGSSSDAPSAPPPTRVLLDTNALLLPFTRGLDLAGEVRRWAGAASIAIPSTVRAELETLVARGVRFARAAREWAGSLPTAAAEGRGDTALLRLARRTGDWVVTGDRELRDRLLAADVPVLEPRSGAKLALRLPRPRSRPSDRATVMKRPKLLGRPRGGVRRAAR